MSKKIIKVGYLARVEGEGSLYIRTEGSSVEEVKLKIFEPPRFFEGFLVGRSYTEAPDITARICGICPVAYQMSTVHCIEDAFGTVIPRHIKQLRRLLYCGEWIESHALHVLMLHAPDFLGLHDAITLAKIHRSQVEDGLRIKKVGNKLISILGGREIHPINVKVGGFYQLPQASRLLAITDELKWAKDAAYNLLKWVSSFDFPQMDIDYEFVSLKNDTEYPYNDGHIHSNKGLDITPCQYEENFIEEHVPHSTALHSRRAGGGSYLTGPMARFANNYELLPAEVKKAAEEFSIDRNCTNSYRSIQVRLLEIMFSLDDALSIIGEYDERNEPSVDIRPRAATGFAATEAPRGILFHKFELDRNGDILAAKIVPPTSQNQKRIEDDLRQVIADCIDLPEQELTHRCEQTIRNFDPCISCATHFLNTTIVRN